MTDEARYKAARVLRWVSLVVIGVVALAGAVWLHLMARATRPIYDAGPKFEGNVVEPTPPIPPGCNDQASTTSALNHFPGRKHVWEIAIMGRKEAESYRLKLSELEIDLLSSIQDPCVRYGYAFWLRFYTRQVDERLNVLEFEQQHGVLEPKKP